MKKFRFLSIVAILTICLFQSCKDDGGTSAIELEEGAVVNLEKVFSETNEGFIDLIRVGQGENPEIRFTVELAAGNPVTTDIVGAYQTVSGETYFTVLFPNASLPGEFSMTVDDIVAAFAELERTNIAVGDNLSLSARFTMEDGRVLDLIDPVDGSNNTGTNIQANTPIYDVRIEYPVSCPSDLTGTYLVITTADGCCGVPSIANSEAMVTVTADGGGIYTLSDMAAGAYDALFCGAFGICGTVAAASGQITDVCGDLSGSTPDCCGGTVQVSGTVNPDGSWSMDISSDFMSGTQIWVKQ
ncbi:hypothetical protein [Flagellimonas meishanensis]|uniref:hypothetical protein n=1 Tax=Flagellimonas meishanensis TaxID=2873264 RepID=UPI001CA6E56A|nr:hypothetical protein [[Muricauda] meishanensis]